jgi:phosphoenolpyruvate synthase/pyruvate phosphate dikinase
LNREPWGKAPRQNATILKEKGNKYLQQAQPEVRQTEGGEKVKKAKKANKTKLKQLQGLQPELDGRMKTCFDPNEMF